MRLLVTNGGPHPADKWAAITAHQIGDLIQIDEHSASPEAVAARIAKPKLMTAITEALAGHHHAVQKHERGKIDEHGHERLSHSLDAREHVPATLDEAFRDVMLCTKDSAFKAHFDQAHVQDVVRGILGSHFATSMHIERSWHADGKTIEDGKVIDNPDHDPEDDHVIAFRERHDRDPKATA